MEPMPLAQVFIKEEVVLPDTYVNCVEPPTLSSSFDPIPEKQSSESNPFYEVLLNEANYTETQDNSGPVIELNSDVECISVKSDDSDVEEVPLLNSQGPQPVAPLLPAVLNVRTIDSWEAPTPEGSLDAPVIVSEYSIDPLSRNTLSTDTDGLSHITGQSKPMEFFNLLVSKNLYTMIVNETNKYGSQLMADATLPHSRMKNFREISVSEFKRFLGLFYHMGNVKITNACNYWMMGRYFHIRIFGETMGRNRFYQIIRSLHFNAEGSLKEDRFAQIRPILEYFNNIMKIAYRHVENTSYKEELAVLRAKLIYHQYRKPKRGKCEIRMYMLTDPNGVVLKLYIPGKNDAVYKQTESELIQNLLEDELTKVNSTNPENGNTNCADTAKRKASTDHEDDNIDNQKRLKQDETSENLPDSSACVFRWEDTENMLGIFIDFNDEVQSKSREQLTNPHWKNYGYISRINLKDRMQSFYACDRESLPQHIKVGLHILQLLLLNAYALYKKHTNSKLSFLRFRMNIIQELIGEYMPLSLDSTSMTDNNDTIHLPANCPRSDKNRVLKRQCVQCKLLKGKRVESIFMCPLCPGQPGLCLENCFRDYHNYM